MVPSELPFHCEDALSKGSDWLKKRGPIRLPAAGNICVGTGTCSFLPNVAE